uniref:Uncharacterized protein n=1 Tax=Brassica oleracea TaxID=3712 RepID=A0A3P6DMR1_BRAOL|nr:unnamed protein product [Brassica oleracea]
MNQGDHIINNGEGSVCCFSETTTTSSNPVYNNPMTAATKSSEDEDDISLSLLPCKTKSIRSNLWSVFS